MPETSGTTADEVEHEVFMPQGVILLIVEPKLANKTELEHTAQVLDLLKANDDEDFERHPPVHAILTDLLSFLFLFL